MLILLEAGPIRKKAMQEVRRANAELNRTTLLIEEFEQVHYPSFQQWQAQEFGALLTELRELQRLIDEKNQLIGEVEWEFVTSGGSDPYTAYKRVMRRRAAASEPQPEQENPFESQGEESEPSAPSIEEMFEDFVNTTFGVRTDSMDPMLYGIMFAAFKAKFDPPPRPEEKPFQAPKVPQAEKPGHSRLKTLYRSLVRRLHPDGRSDSVPAKEKELWLAVQAAYQAGDLEQLEVLSAKADWLGGQIGDHTSISQLRGIAAEIRASLKSVRHRLKEAKTHWAWNFCKSPIEILDRKHRRELTQQLQEMQRYAAHLDEQIRQFSVAPPSRRGEAHRQRRPSKKR